MSALLYNVRGGRHQAGLGGGAGAGVGYRFRVGSHRFELSGGIEASLYNSTAAIAHAEYTNLPFRGYGEPLFKVNAALMNYEETQRAAVVAIPVMVRYHFYRKYRYYAGAGVKVGFPVYSHYRIRQGVARVRAPYGYEDYTYDNPALEMGLGEYPVLAADNAEIAAGTLVMLAVEVGMQWRLSQYVSVYTSLYADAGLNSIRQGSAVPFFLSYNPAQEGNQKVRSAGAAASLYTNNDGAPAGAMAERLSTLAAGVRVTFNFGARDHPHTLADAYSYAGYAGAAGKGVFVKRDTIIRRDTIRIIKTEIVEKRDTIVIYDDTVPAPIPDPVALAAPAPADTTMPPFMLHRRYFADSIDLANAKPAGKKRKNVSRRSYQVQVMASRYAPDMSYFDALIQEYPQFKLRTIDIGVITHYTYGVFSTFDEARRWAYRFVALGYTDVFVVQVENDKITKSFYNNK